jgi:hypothetical protein
VPEGRIGLIVGVAVGAVAVVAVGLLGLGWWVWRRRQQAVRPATGKLYNSDASNDVLVVMRPQDTSNLADMPGLSKGVSAGQWSDWLLCLTRAG